MLGMCEHIKKLLFLCNLQTKTWWWIIRIEEGQAYLEAFGICKALHSAGNDLHVTLTEILQRHDRWIVQIKVVIWECNVTRETIIVRKSVGKWIVVKMMMDEVKKFGFR